MAEQALLYTAIAAWGTWATVGCALLIVWVQNRAAKRLTCLQLFVQIAAQYDSADMQRIRARLADRLLADSTTLEVEDSLLVLFENLAILTRRDLLDYELVWNTFGFDVPRYWWVLRHYIEHCRKKHSDSSLFEEFEKLSERLRLSERSPLGTHLSQPNLTSEESHDFLHHESLRGPDH